MQEAAKSAQPGTENVMAAMKTVIDSANAGYQQINRSAKQVADVSGENLNAADEQFAQASYKASGAEKSTATK